MQHLKCPYFFFFLEMQPAQLHVELDAVRSCQKNRNLPRIRLRGKMSSVFRRGDLSEGEAKIKFWLNRQITFHDLKMGSLTLFVEVFSQNFDKLLKPLNLL